MKRILSACTMAIALAWTTSGLQAQTARSPAAGTSAVAHAVEHMLFKGTEQLQPGEFSRRVAAIGGSENAFTSFDYTGYYQQIPSGRLRRAGRPRGDPL